MVPTMWNTIQHLSIFSYFNAKDIAKMEGSSYVLLILNLILRWNHEFIFIRFNVHGININQLILDR